MMENGIRFYWKETEELPALEVMVELEKETNKFILKYIKEEARAEKEQFEWNTENNSNNGIVYIYKQDPLDDVIDMNER